jgi:hypothetical protein
MEAHFVFFSLEEWKLCVLNVSPLSLLFFWSMLQIFFWIMDKSLEWPQLVFVCLFSFIKLFVISFFIFKDSWGARCCHLFLYYSWCAKYCYFIFFDHFSLKVVPLELFFLLLQRCCLPICHWKHHILSLVENPISMILFTTRKPITEDTYDSWSDK